ncbi:MAG: hypothetical protein PHS17_19460, partial [Desulfobacterales bacterium]|nr:hypothetical protein [Desulfobacterales bacterium]
MIRRALAVALITSGHTIRVQFDRQWPLYRIHDKGGRQAVAQQLCHCPQILPNVPKKVSVGR